MAFSCSAESFMDFYIHCSCHNRQKPSAGVKKFLQSILSLLPEKCITCMGLINAVEIDGGEREKLLPCSVEKHFCDPQESLQIMVDVCQHPSYFRRRHRQCRKNNWKDESRMFQSISQQRFQVGAKMWNALLFCRSLKVAIEKRCHAIPHRLYQCFSYINVQFYYPENMKRHKQHDWKIRTRGKENVMYRKRFPTHCVLEVPFFEDKRSR